MHTHHSGIESTWIQNLDDSHYCKVFIWNSAESMMVAFRTNTYTDIDECLGRCMSSCSVKRDGKNIAPPKFAEIHLVREEIGAGYVAHEIQHLTHYWSVHNHWNRIRHDEKIAYFCSDFTTEFWNNFYKRYENTKTDSGSRGEL